MTVQIDVNSNTSHPLDGCDVDDCYKTMMSERTELIKARREAEDNLVKTVIQLSSTLIVLMAGFITQGSVVISADSFWCVAAALALLLIALAAGLSEHIFSSRAYLAQQKLVEQYYTKVISEFQEPKANYWVRVCQAVSYGSFVLALLALAIFTVIQVGERSHGKPAATAPTTSSSAATIASQPNERWVGRRTSREVGRADDAAPAPEEGRLNSTSPSQH